MQVTTFETGKTVDIVAHQMTAEEMQREFDYYLAEKMTHKMKENGLISEEECTRIMDEIRGYFSPFLAELT